MQRTLPSGGYSSCILLSEEGLITMSTSCVYVEIMDWCFWAIHQEIVQLQSNSVLDGSYTSQWCRSYKVWQMWLTFNCVVMHSNRAHDNVWKIQMTCPIYHVLVVKRNQKSNIIGCVSLYSFSKHLSKKLLKVFYLQRIKSHQIDTEYTYIAVKIWKPLISCVRMMENNDKGLCKYIWKINTCIRLVQK